MTRLEAQAFNYADETCPWCKGEENPEGFCDASALMKGYMAGFAACRKEASDLAKILADDYSALRGDGNVQRSIVLRQFQAALAVLAADPEPDTYDVKSEGAGGDGSLA